MGLGIYVRGAHVVNAISPIMPEVTYKEVFLLLHGLWRRRVVPVGCAYGPGRICLRPLHGATCEYEGVVAHMRGGE